MIGCGVLLVYLVGSKDDIGSSRHRMIGATDDDTVGKMAQSQTSD